jgi:RNA polymerase-associated protein
MKLYQVEKCPFAHRVRISLEEKKLKYEVVYFASHKRPPELEAMGPDARSPTLFDDDGAVVWDSTIVCEYLDERYPETPLMPPDPAGRAHARTLVKQIEAKVAPFVHELERADFAPGDPKVAETLARVRAALEPFEARLRARPFLLGDAFSLADVALFAPIVGMVRHLAERGDMLAELPALVAFRDRVAARPSTVY